MNLDSEELIRQAWLVREDAYAPYSKFKVGAALLSDDGRIFTGCNVENASLGLTICAERVALTGAVAYGYSKLIGLALAADTEDAIAPCGACRQFLAEFNPRLLLISQARGDTRQWLLQELLPCPFTATRSIN